MTERTSKLYPITPKMIYENPVLYRHLLEFFFGRPMMQEDEECSDLQKWQLSESFADWLSWEEDCEWTAPMQ